MKKTFPSFDLGIDHLFSSDPWKELKQKKEEQQRFARLDVSELDDLVDGAQAKTTKYFATKYAVIVQFKVIFAFNYCNKILKITFCFSKKMYNEIKRELCATCRECEICSNQILHGRSVAAFWLSNVQKMTIKTRKNVLDSSPV